MLSFFGMFGKYSTYMWLTHIFLTYRFLWQFVAVGRVSIVMYLLLVIESLIIAYLLQNIEIRFVRCKNGTD